MELEQTVNTIAQAFIEMINEQPSNVYDYELIFKDYNNIRHQKTLIPAPALPRDIEQTMNLIRVSVSSFVDFLLKEDIVLGEPDNIEVTYGTLELGIDDAPDVCNNMIRATLHVTWKSKWDPELSSKKGGLDD